jgi:hypothetical protein
VEGKLQQDAGADEQPQCLQAGGQDHLRIVHWTQLGYHGRPDRAKDKVQKRKRQSKVRALLFIFFVLFCCAKLINCLDGLIRFDCTPKEAPFFAQSFFGKPFPNNFGMAVLFSKSRI